MKMKPTGLREKMVRQSTLNALL